MSSLSDLRKLKQYMGAYYQEPDDEELLLAQLEDDEYPSLAAYHLWSQLPAQINVGNVKMHMSGSEQTTFQSFKDVLTFCQSQARYFLLKYQSDRRISSNLAVCVKRSEF